jgi:hypothetical protein
MQADGAICHYAIGGAVGAAYYSEPATANELEVLVVLPFNPNGSSVSLTAWHEYLMCHGWKAGTECFELEGWPVRFLVADNDLEKEAVASSLPAPVDGERTWVVMAEHLMAIALTANRLSDRMWMLRLTECDAIDEMGLKAILRSHGLIERWTQFEREYPPQFPSESEMRKKLSALSFSEKIKILEKLRDRSRTIAAAGLRSEERKKDSV